MVGELDLAVLPDCRLSNFGVLKFFFRILSSHGITIPKVIRKKSESLSKIIASKIRALPDQHYLATLVEAHFPTQAIVDRRTESPDDWVNRNNVKNK